MKKVISCALGIFVLALQSRAAEPRSASVRKPNIIFRYEQVTGIGHEAGVCRRDPSDVIKVGPRYYVWYSRVAKDQPLYPSGYHATVWYAVSVDAGRHWVEKGEALGKGQSGNFDSTGVFTPNILAWRGKYYLYYTAVGDGFSNTGYTDNERTVIGLAVADSPDGPWTKLRKPILQSTRDPKKFDSFRVDDSCLRVANGRVWLYYKGRQWKNTPANARMGVAVADRPEGPYRRLNDGNPIQDSGHEVQIFEQDGSLYSMVSPTGLRGNTLRFSGEGLGFDSDVVGKLEPAAPGAPGLYRPELTGDKVESRERWGIAMATKGADPYLTRYAFSLPPPRKKVSTPALRATQPTTLGKPNIVLILIDDMGYADIGPFGNGRVRTPNLDRMAAEGRKFTSFYATPVCSMSRACLMTGCYNARVSIPGVLFPKDKIGLNPHEITLAKIVKPKGYATTCIGKWHLGCLPEFLPTRQGFDSYFGLPYSNDMGTGNTRYRFPPLPLMRDQKTIETEPDQSQFTRRYTEEAVKFIRAHREGPFFLYLPHTMIHNPLAASKAFRGNSRMGLLGDAIEEIDWSVGQILRTLKELNLDEQTLVIFTSDNGPAGRAAPPFRGSKGSNFEGGVREPCIMRWPGRIPAGTTCNQIAGNIDVLPTMAKLVGVPPPADRVIDGKDITTLMFEPHPGSVRDTHLYFDAGQRLAAIRQGDWKLFVGSDKGATQAVSNREDGKKMAKKGKGRASRAPAHALYNLVNDPGETKDVSAAHADIVARLRAEAKNREAEVLRNKRAPGRAAAGK